MSYLQRPRMHFAGRFRADVSTVNNTPANFQEAGFSLQSSPLWNPFGTAWFGVDCKVTSVCYRDGTDASSPDDDPVVGLAFGSPAPRMGQSARLVDLDSEQQGVSQIFGLQLSLVTPDAQKLLDGAFVVAPFTDILGPFVPAPNPYVPQGPNAYNFWPRMPALQFDQMAGAFYQSQLVKVTFGGDVGSRFLTELTAEGAPATLSIRFNVDGMMDDSEYPRFPTGRLVGTIGLAQADEPVRVTLGRQIFSLGVQTNPPPSNPIPPTQNPLPPAQFNNAVAIVDGNAGKVIVDLGNALQSNPVPGPLLDNGEIAIGYSVGGTFYLIDTVHYTGDGWYEQTAGVVDLPSGRVLAQAELVEIFANPLQLVTFDANGNPVVQASEAPNGEWVRADDFVLRLNAGDAATVTLYATKFGQPLPNAVVSCFADDGALAGNPPGSPDVGIPANFLQFASSVTTGATGVAQLQITSPAAGPGIPRGYIDGQVYAVRPVLQNFLTSGGPVNPSDFVSVLAWSAYTAPAQPTWWTDVRPILLQYANLYPVMRQYVDLSDYDSVTANGGTIAFTMSLHPEDPRYMPVTRDLSLAKKNMIRAWLATTGNNGKPNLGTPPPKAEAVKALRPEAVAAAATAPPPTGGTRHRSGR